MTTSRLSDPALVAIQRSFAESERSTAAEALQSLPNDWVREAILILAEGDLQKLRQLIELSELDYREILVRMDPNSWSGIAENELVRRRESLGLLLPKTPSEKRQQQLREDVYDFVARHVKISIASLSDSVRLQADLSLGESEGEMFVRSFASRFHVNTQKFNPTRYFVPRMGEHPFRDLFRSIISRRAAPTVDITIGDLIRIAECRTWDIPTESR